MNINKEIKELIGNGFIPPIKEYYFGKIIHYTPYFLPMNFSKTILFIRRLYLTPKEVLDKCPNDWIREAKKYSNIPMVRRSKHWIVNIFGRAYYIEIGFPFMIHKNRLGWKDKWNSPRFEWNPSFMIFFFNWQFCIHWVAPTDDSDLYWEMVLWYSEYCNKDIEKAEKTWGWTNCETGKSTWNKNCLKQQIIS